MKTTLLIFFLAINYSFSQSISDYLEIKEIKQISISFSPNMEGINSQNKVVKIVKDNTFIGTTLTLLQELPSTGPIHKSFPKTIPTWSIGILDQDNELHTLTFYGIKLRVPDSSDGSFYYGSKAAELEKKLYLLIRTQMIGDWYNCE